MRDFDSPKFTESVFARGFFLQIVRDSLQNFDFAAENEKWTSLFQVAVLTTELSISKLVELLECSMPTVDQWLNGVSVPNCVNTELSSKSGRASRSCGYCTMFPPEVRRKIAGKS